MTEEEFIVVLSPVAKASALATGIPASFTVAEGALESRYGNSDLAKVALNLFGVKADSAWRGDTVSMPTREELSDGTWTTSLAVWRKYSSLDECVADHANFFKANKRYSGALSCTNGEEFANAVQAAGYASDKAYAAKVIAIMRQYNLGTLDAATPVVEPPPAAPAPTGVSMDAPQKASSVVTGAAIGSAAGIYPVVDWIFNGAIRPPPHEVTLILCGMLVWLGHLAYNVIRPHLFPNQTGDQK